MSNLNIVVTTAFGLEGATGGELKRLGYRDLKVDNGAISFTGTMSDIAKCNMWIRTAGKIHIKLAEFKAVTFTDLFDSIFSIHWGDWLEKDFSFPVLAVSQQSQLFSLSDCQAIGKKAIVEKLKNKYKVDWFPETGPTCEIMISIKKDIVSVLINTSGDGLFKRGYRRMAGEAPIKESMAAALVFYSGWRGQEMLIDPFCGSGTIPIEAAMIGRNIAPGLKRDFDFTRWNKDNLKLFEKEKEMAQEAEKKDFSCKIFGFDKDPEVLEIAKNNAKLAGVDGYVSWHCKDIEELLDYSQPITIITNPPYGERMGSQPEMEKIYDCLRKLSSQKTDWKINIISSDHNLEKKMCRKAFKKRKLFNAKLECNFYQFGAGTK